MRKKLLAFTLIIIMIFALTFAGCNSDDGRINFVYRVDDEINVFLNVGETAEINFAELLDYYIPNIHKIEMVSSNKGVFTVHENKIKAVHEGEAYAKLIAYSTPSKNTYMPQAVITVNVRVVNISKLVEVRTAQDLADISKDMNGAYILKSDIDLKDFGDWKPISTYSQDGFFSGNFRGVFINPEGYKIKNMTIKSIGDFPNSRSWDLGIGLFESLDHAFIDGLILENISIDTTACADRELSAGGICGYSLMSVMRNCTVSGAIISQESVGGIVGRFSNGLIIGCSFKGTVENTSSNAFGGAGGIVGVGYETFKFFDCAVEATISGMLYAGGILGHFTGSALNYYKVEEEFIKGYSFLGKLNAQYTGEMCGLVGFSPNE